MGYTIFSDKEMLKQDKELVELHNVRNFFFRPINLFIQALLLGQLDEISDYINPNKNGKRKKKRTRKV